MGCITIGQRKPRSKKWQLIFLGTMIPGIEKSYNMNALDICRPGRKYRIVETSQLYRIWEFLGG